MAGYIWWEKGLAKKREVLIIAHALKVDPDLVAARLMRLWEWCDENIPEEAINKDTEDAVIVLSPERGDTEAFIDGEARLPGLAKLLASDAVGWLKYLNKGRVKLVRYGRHNGTTGKTRIRNARNQARRRKNGVTAMSPFGDDIPVSYHNPTTPPPKEESVRSSEDSLVGVQGEAKEPPLEFESLARLESQHLDDIRDLCAIHRAANEEHPRIVPATEDGLLRIIGAAARAKRKAKTSRAGFFRGLLRKRLLHSIDADELSEARKELEKYRAAIKARIARNEPIERKHFPLCDEEES